MTNNEVERMNITFLLGNGFDIGLRMPTRYEDFYRKYCKISDEDTDNIRAFKEMLLKRNDEDTKKIINWSDFEKAFGEHSADETLNKTTYIERFEDFVRRFNTYLEDVEKCVDLSNTDEVGRIMDEACTSCFKIRRADEDAINTFFRRFDSVRTYNFATFNYTKTVDRCVDALRQRLRSMAQRSVGSVVHIHGYIEENMIVGVNDPSQILNPNFAGDPDIVAELVKPRQNSDSRTAYEKALKAVIDGSNVICVYGMSIGATDKIWWDYISQWLSKSDTRILLILSHEEKYNKRFPFDQKRFIDPIVSTFMSYSSLTNTEKDKIRSRMYVGINNDVFAMNAFSFEAFEKMYPSDPPENDLQNRVNKLEKRLNEQPRIIVSDTEPTDHKKGDIWLKPVAPH